MQYLLYSHRYCNPPTPITFQMPLLRNIPQPPGKKTEGDVGWGVSLTLKNEAVSSFIWRRREEILCFGTSQGFLLSQRQGGKLHTIRDYILFL